MSSMRLHSIEMLYLLWLLPLLLGLFLYSANRRKQLLQHFIHRGLQQKLVFVNPVRRRWKAVLLLAGFGLLVISLARPAWNLEQTTITRTGRDVVFVLDVSRSMLAEDLAPNRLERAKLAIADVIDKLRGDRVGLLVFAGTAAVKCPLTLDYGFFRMMLDNVSTESISRGGTMIGDALRLVLDQMLDAQEKKYKDIVLITDGEDHESFPIEAAKAAAEKGVRLFIIGLGDENEGKRIPVVDASGRRTFMRYEGKEIWSRLDAETLREMALAAPGSRYLNVATGTIDLGEVYMQLIGSAEKKEQEEETIEKYEEKFQVFIGICFLLLCIEALISERRRG
ncbi:MAG: VWA domain-containing protein [Desulfobulbaceae bacterium]|jgi:Ca-activated chloride channel homolog|nr:VWA domain-containing protein [Desulfobulbaceae bacterium]MDH3922618.1 VWA domain-containing protein [Desulfobulbaceae bacterium]